MFPPQKTKNVQTFLNGMLSSLVRGGLEAHEEISVDPSPDEEKTFMVKVPLYAPASKDAWSALRRYTRQYAQESGWRLEQVRQARGLLLFRASSA